MRVVIARRRFYFLAIDVETAMNGVTKPPPA
jgi:hypothetical protein